MLVAGALVASLHVGPALASGPEGADGHDPQNGATQPAARGRYFPFLAGEHTDRSISVGDTSNGYLIAAKELTENKRLGILPRQKKRDLRYGSAALVGALQHAARALHTKTGRKLWA